MQSTIHPWTVEEDAVMREHYPSGDVAAIAAATGRSHWAIRHRAKKLNLQTWRRWTDVDKNHLCEAWGKTKMSDLARQLGRRPAACKGQAARMGLDAGRSYTDEEKALIRELYPTHTATQIAERIHGQPRSAKAIYHQACLLGLRKVAALEPELIETVRVLLTTEDLTDAAAARRLRLTREQITHIRIRHLGLPRNEAAIKAAARRGVKSQYRRLGIHSPGQLRALVYRNYAAANGWPEDLRPRSVQILNYLATRPEGATALEIAKHIGMSIGPFRSGKRRILLSSNDREGTYTAHLLARGLILAQRISAGPGGGQGSHHNVYFLSLLAIEMIERFNNGIAPEERRDKEESEHDPDGGAEANSRSDRGDVDAGPPPGAV